jgi:hypothetical protein
MEEIEELHYDLKTYELKKKEFKNMFLSFKEELKDIESKKNSLNYSNIICESISGATKGFIIGSFLDIALECIIRPNFRSDYTLCIGGACYSVNQEYKKQKEENPLIFERKSIEVKQKYSNWLSYDEVNIKEIIRCFNLEFDSIFNSMTYDNKDIKINEINEYIRKNLELIILCIHMYIDYQYNPLNINNINNMNPIGNLFEKFIEIEDIFSIAVNDKNIINILFYDNLNIFEQNNDKDFLEFNKKIKENIKKHLWYLFV